MAYYNKKWLLLNPFNVVWLAEIKWRKWENKHKNCDFVTSGDYLLGSPEQPRKKQRLYRSSWTNWFGLPQASQIKEFHCVLTMKSLGCLKSCQDDALLTLGGLGLSQAFLEIPFRAIRLFSTGQHGTRLFFFSESENTLTSWKEIHSRLFPRTITHGVLIGRSFTRRRGLSLDCIFCRNFLQCLRSCPCLELPPSSTYPFHPHCRLYAYIVTLLAWWNL